MILEHSSLYLAHAKKQSNENSLTENMELLSKIFLSITTLSQTIKI